LGVGGFQKYNTHVAAPPPRIQHIAIEKREPVQPAIIPLRMRERRKMANELAKAATAAIVAIWILVCRTSAPQSLLDSASTTPFI
jgi:hypothetical protein